MGVKYILIFFLAMLIGPAGGELSTPSVGGKTGPKVLKDLNDQSSRNDYQQVSNLYKAEAESHLLSAFQKLNSLHPYERTTFLEKFKSSPSDRKEVSIWLSSLFPKGSGKDFDSIRNSLILWNGKLAFAHEALLRYNQKNTGDSFNIDQWEKNNDEATKKIFAQAAAPGGGGEGEQKAKQPLDPNYVANENLKRECKQKPDFCKEKWAPICQNVTQTACADIEKKCAEKPSTCQALALYCSNNPQNCLDPMKCLADKKCIIEVPKAGDEKTECKTEECKKQVQKVTTACDDNPEKCTALADLCKALPNESAEQTRKRCEAAKKCLTDRTCTTPPPFSVALPNSDPEGNCQKTDYKAKCDQFKELCKKEPQACQEVANYCQAHPGVCLDLKTFLSSADPKHAVPATLQGLTSAKTSISGSAQGSDNGQQGGTANAGQGGGRFGGEGDATGNFAGGGEDSVWGACKDLDAARKALNEGKFFERTAGALGGRAGNLVDGVQGSNIGNQLRHGGSASDILFNQSGINQRIGTEIITSIMNSKCHQQMREVANWTNIDPVCEKITKPPATQTGPQPPSASDCPTALSQAQPLPATQPVAALGQSLEGLDPQTLTAPKSPQERQKEVVASVAKMLLSRYVPAYFEMLINTPGMSPRKLTEESASLINSCALPQTQSLAVPGSHVVDAYVPGALPAANAAYRNLQEMRARVGAPEKQAAINDKKAYIQKLSLDQIAQFTNDKKHKQSQEYREKAISRVDDLMALDANIQTLWEDFGGPTDTPTTKEWMQETLGPLAMCTIAGTFIDAAKSKKVGQCSPELRRGTAATARSLGGGDCQMPTAESVRAGLEKMGKPADAASVQDKLNTLQEQFNNYLGQWTAGDEVITSFADIKTDREIEAAEREERDKQQKLAQAKSEGSGEEKDEGSSSASASPSPSDSGNGKSAPRATSEATEAAPSKPTPLYKKDDMKPIYGVDGKISHGMCWLERCKVKENVLKQLISKRAEILNDYPELARKYDNEGNPSGKFDAKPLYKILYSQKNRGERFKKELEGSENSHDQKAIKDVIAKLCSDPESFIEDVISDDSMMEQFANCKSSLTAEEEQGLRDNPLLLQKTKSDIENCKKIKSNLVTACGLRRNYKGNVTRGIDGGLRTTNRGQGNIAAAIEFGGMIMDAESCMPVLSTVGGIAKGAASFSKKAVSAFVKREAQTTVAQGMSRALARSARWAQRSARRAAVAVGTSRGRAAVARAAGSALVTKGGQVAMVAGHAVFDAKSFFIAFVMNSSQSDQQHGAGPIAALSDLLNNPLSSLQSIAGRDGSRTYRDQSGSVGQMKKTIANCRARNDNGERMASAESCAHFDRSIGVMWFNGMVRDQILSSVAMMPIGKLIAGDPHKPLMTQETAKLYKEINKGNPEQKTLAEKRFVEQGVKDFAKAMGVSEQQARLMLQAMGGNPDVAVILKEMAAKTNQGQGFAVSESQIPKLQKIINDPDIAKYLENLDEVHKKGGADQQKLQGLVTDYEKFKALEGQGLLSPDDAKKYRQHLDLILQQVLKDTKEAPPRSAAIEDRIQFLHSQLVPTEGQSAGDTAAATVATRTDANGVVIFEGPISASVSSPATSPTGPTAADPNFRQRTERRGDQRVAVERNNLRPPASTDTTPLPPDVRRMINNEHEAASDAHFHDSSNPQAIILSDAQIIDMAKQRPQVGDIYIGPDGKPKKVTKVGPSTVELEGDQPISLTDFFNNRDLKVRELVPRSAEEVSSYYRKGIVRLTLEQEKSLMASHPELGAWYIEQTKKGDSAYRPTEQDLRNFAGLRPAAGDLYTDASGNKLKFFERIGGMITLENIETGRRIKLTIKDLSENNTGVRLVQLGDRAPAEIISFFKRRENEIQQRFLDATRSYAQFRGPVYKLQTALAELERKLQGPPKKEPTEEQIAWKKDKTTRLDEAKAKLKPHEDELTEAINKQLEGHGIKVKVAPNGLGINGPRFIIDVAGSDPHHWLIQNLANNPKLQGLEVGIDSVVFSPREGYGGYYDKGKNFLSLSADSVLATNCDGICGHELLHTMTDRAAPAIITQPPTQKTAKDFLRQSSGSARLFDRMQIHHDPPSAWAELLGSYKKQYTVDEVGGFTKSFNEQWLALSKRINETERQINADLERARGTHGEAQALAHARERLAKLQDEIQNPESPFNRMKKLAEEMDKRTQAILTSAQNGKTTFNKDTGRYEVEFPDPADNKKTIKIEIEGASRRQFQVIEIPSAWGAPPSDALRQLWWNQKITEIHLEDIGDKATSLRKRMERMTTNMNAEINTRQGELGIPASQRPSLRLVEGGTETRPQHPPISGVGVVDNFDLAAGPAPAPARFASSAKDGPPPAQGPGASPQSSVLTAPPLSRQQDPRVLESMRDSVQRANPHLPAQEIARLPFDQLQKMADDASFKEALSSFKKDTTPPTAVAPHPGPILSTRTAALPDLSVATFSKLNTDARSKAPTAPPTHVYRGITIDVADYSQGTFKPHPIQDINGHPPNTHYASLGHDQMIAQALKEYKEANPQGVPLSKGDKPVFYRVVSRAELLELLSTGQSRANGSITDWGRDFISPAEKKWLNDRKIYENGIQILESLSATGVTPVDVSQLKRDFKARFGREIPQHFLTHEEVRNHFVLHLKNGLARESTHAGTKNRLPETTKALIAKYTNNGVLNEAALGQYIEEHILSLPPGPKRNDALLDLFGFDYAAHMHADYVPGFNQFSPFKGTSIGLPMGHFHKQNTFLIATRDIHGRARKNLGNGGEREWFYKDGLALDEVVGIWGSSDLDNVPNGRIMREGPEVTRDATWTTYINTNNTQGLRGDPKPIVREIPPHETPAEIIRLRKDIKTYYPKIPPEALAQLSVEKMNAMMEQARSRVGSPPPLATDSRPTPSNPSGASTQRSPSPTVLPPASPPASAIHPPSPEKIVIVDGLPLVAANEQIAEALGRLASLEAKKPPSLSALRSYAEEAPGWQVLISARLGDIIIFKNPDGTQKTASVLLVDGQTGKVTLEEVFEGQRQKKVYDAKSFASRVGDNDVQISIPIGSKREYRTNAPIESDMGRYQDLIRKAQKRDPTLKIVYGKAATEYLKTKGGGSAAYSANSNTVYLPEGTTFNTLAHELGHHKQLLAVDRGATATSEMRRAASNLFKREYPSTKERDQIHYFSREAEVEVSEIARQRKAGHTSEVDFLTLRLEEHLKGIEAARLEIRKKLSEADALQFDRDVAVIKKGIEDAIKTPAPPRESPAAAQQPSLHINGRAVLSTAESLDHARAHFGTRTDTVGSKITRWDSPEKMLADPIISGALKELSKYTNAGREIPPNLRAKLEKKYGIKIIEYDPSRSRLVINLTTREPLGVSSLRKINPGEKVKLEDRGPFTAGAVVVGEAIPSKEVNLIFGENRDKTGIVLITAMPGEYAPPMPPKAIAEMTAGKTPQEIKLIIEEWHKAELAKPEANRSEILKHWKPEDLRSVSEFWAQHALVTTPEKFAESKTPLLSAEGSASAKVTTRTDKNGVVIFEAPVVASSSSQSVFPNTKRGIAPTVDNPDFRTRRTIRSDVDVTEARNNLRPPAPPSDTPVNLLAAARERFNADNGGQIILTDAQIIDMAKQNPKVGDVYIGPDGKSHQITGFGLNSVKFGSESIPLHTLADNSQWKVHDLVPRTAEETSLYQRKLFCRLTLEQEQFLIKSNPEAANWYIEQTKKGGSAFRPSEQQLRKLAAEAPVAGDTYIDSSGNKFKFKSKANGIIILENISNGAEVKISQQQLSEGKAGVTLAQFGARSPRETIEPLMRMEQDIQRRFLDASDTYNTARTTLAKLQEMKDKNPNDPTLDAKIVQAKSALDKVQEPFFTALNNQMNAHGIILIRQRGYNDRGPAFVIDETMSDPHHWLVKNLAKNNKLNGLNVGFDSLVFSDGERIAGYHSATAGFMSLSREDVLGNTCKGICRHELVHLATAEADPVIISQSPTQKSGKDFLRQSGGRTRLFDRMTISHDPPKEWVKKVGEAYQKSYNVDEVGAYTKSYNDAWLAISKRIHEEEKQINSELARAKGTPEEPLALRRAHERLQKLQDEIDNPNSSYNAAKQQAEAMDDRNRSIMAAALALGKRGFDPKTNHTFFVLKDPADPSKKIYITLEGPSRRQFRGAEIPDEWNAPRSDELRQLWWNQQLTEIHQEEIASKANSLRQQLKKMSERLNQEIARTEVALETRGRTQIGMGGPANPPIQLSVVTSKTQVGIGGPESPPHRLPGFGRIEEPGVDVFDQPPSSRIAASQSPPHPPMIERASSVQEVLEIARGDPQLLSLIRAVEQAPNDSVKLAAEEALKKYFYNIGTDANVALPPQYPRAGKGDKIRPFLEGMGLQGLIPGSEVIWHHPSAPNVDITVRPKDKEPWARVLGGQELREGPKFKVYLKISPKDLMTHFPSIIKILDSKTTGYQFKFAFTPDNIYRSDRCVAHFSTPEEAIAFAASYEAFAKQQKIQATGDIPFSGDIGEHFSVGRDPALHGDGSSRSALVEKITTGIVDPTFDWSNSISQSLKIDPKTFIPHEISVEITNLRQDVGTHYPQIPPEALAKLSVATLNAMMEQVRSGPKSSPPPPGPPTPNPRPPSVIAIDSGPSTPRGAPDQAPTLSMQQDPRVLESMRDTVRRAKPHLSEQEIARLPFDQLQKMADDANISFALIEEGINRKISGLPSDPKAEAALVLSRAELEHLRQNPQSDTAKRLGERKRKLTIITEGAPSTAPTQVPQTMGQTVAPLIERAKKETDQAKKEAIIKDIANKIYEERKENLPFPLNGVDPKDPKLHVKYISKLGDYEPLPAHRNQDIFWQHKTLKHLEIEAKDGEWIRLKNKNAPFGPDKAKFKVYLRISPKDLIEHYQEIIKFLPGANNPFEFKFAFKEQDISRPDRAVAHFATPDDAIRFAEAYARYAQSKGLRPTAEVPLSGQINSYASVGKDLPFSSSSRDTVALDIAKGLVDPNFDAKKSLEQKGFNPNTFVPKEIELGLKLKQMGSSDKAPAPAHAPPLSPPRDVAPPSQGPPSTPLRASELLPPHLKENPDFVALVENNEKLIKEAAECIKTKCECKGNPKCGKAYASLLLVPGEDAVLWLASNPINIVRASDPSRPSKISQSDLKGYKSLKATTTQHDPEFYHSIDRGSLTESMAMAHGEKTKQLGDPPITRSLKDHCDVHISSEIPTDWSMKAIMDDDSGNNKDKKLKPEVIEQRFKQSREKTLSEIERLASENKRKPPPNGLIVDLINLTNPEKLKETIKEITATCSKAIVACKLLCAGDSCPQI